MYLTATLPFHTHTYIHTYCRLNWYCIYLLNNFSISVYMYLKWTILVGCVHACMYLCMYVCMYLCTTPIWYNLPAGGRGEYSCAKKSLGSRNVSLMAAALGLALTALMAAYTSFNVLHTHYAVVRSK